MQNAPLFMLFFAFATSTLLCPTAQAQDCETFEVCRDDIARVVSDELSGDALERTFFAAADAADPVDSGDLGEPTAEDPPKLKPGQAGDLVKAIVATQSVKDVLAKVGDAALAKVETDWDKMKLGEKVMAIAFTAPIATTAVAGILQDMRLARPAQDFINTLVNGVVNKAVPGLNFKLDLVSNNKSFAITLDVFALLRSRGMKL